MCFFLDNVYNAVNIIYFLLWKIGWAQTNLIQQTLKPRQYNVYIDPDKHNIQNNYKSMMNLLKFNI